MDLRPLVVVVGLIATGMAMPPAARALQEALDGEAAAEKRPEEVVEDFFLTVSVYNSFDSEPPVEGVEKNDWGLNTSVGWSF